MSEDTVFMQSTEYPPQEEKIEVHQEECHFYMDNTNPGQNTSRGQNTQRGQQNNSYTNRHPEQENIPEYKVWEILSDYSNKRQEQVLEKVTNAFYGLIYNGDIDQRELYNMEKHFEAIQSSQNQPRRTDAQQEVLAFCSCNWEFLEWNRTTGEPVLAPPDDLWYYLINHKLKAISFAANIFRNLYITRRLTQNQLDNLINHFIQPTVPKQKNNKKTEEQKKPYIQEQTQTRPESKIIIDKGIKEIHKKNEETQQDYNQQDTCHAIITVDDQYNSNTVESDSLSWVKTTIGYTRDQGIQVIAVIDTACTHTTMKYDLFKHIPGNEVIRQTPCNRVTRTANGDYIPIKCIADITYTFKTPEGKQVAIKIPTAIVETPMACDVFLGSDLFTSGYVKHVTPNTYLLTDDPKSGPEIQIPKHKNLFPINIRKNLPTVAGPIKLSAQYQLAPGAAQALHLHIPSYFTKMEQEIQLIIPTEAKYTLKKYPNSDKLTEYHTIMIINNTDSHITIPKDTIIGHMIPIPHQTKTNWTMHQMSQKETENEEKKNAEERNISEIVQQYNIQQAYQETQAPLGMMAMMTTYQTPITLVPEKKEPDITQLHTCFQTEEDISHPALHIFEKDENVELSDLMTNIDHISPDVDYDNKISYRNENLVRSILNNDTWYDPDEVESQLETYRKEGKFERSASTIVSEELDKSTLTMPEDTEDKTPEELIGAIDVKHLSPIQAEQAQALFWENIEVLAKNPLDVEGCPSIAPVKLKLKDDTSIRNQKYYPIPSHYHEETMELLNYMLKKGVLAYPTKPSPIISNILVTKKKSGKLRLLADQRLLNSNLEKLATTLPSMNQIIGTFQGAKYTTSMDLSNAFFSIKLDQETMHYTSFYSPAGQRLCFARLPQGCLISTSILSDLMGQITLGIPGTISCADDILIVGKGTFEEHMLQVNEILKRLVNRNLKLQPAKIDIASPLIKFLGIQFEINKYTIPEARTDAYLKLPKPTTVRQVKGILASVSYYRRFIENYANVIKPLHDLTLGAPKKLLWPDQANKAFLDLKTAIAKAATLYIPRNDWPFIMHTDASAHAIGVSLSQEDPLTKQRYPISFISKMLSKTESNQSTFFKEALALLYALKSHNFYLEGAKRITAYVDARSLLFLRASKQSNSYLARIAVALSQYELDIKHISSSENALSDLLSRSNEGIDKRLSSLKENKPLSVKQSVQLCNQICLPDGFTLSPEQVKNLLGGPPLVSPATKTLVTSTAKSVLNAKRMLPENKGPRVVKLPRITRRHPFYPEQMRELQDYERCYCFLTNTDMQGNIICHLTQIIDEDDIVHTRDFEQMDNLLVQTRSMSKNTVEKDTVGSVAEQKNPEVIPIQLDIPVESRNPEIMDFPVVARTIPITDNPEVEKFVPEAKIAPKIVKIRLLKTVSPASPVSPASSNSETGIATPVSPETPVSEMTPAHPNKMAILENPEPVPIPEVVQAKANTALQEQDISVDDMHTVPPELDYDIGMEDLSRPPSPGYYQTDSEPEEEDNNDSGIIHPTHAHLEIEAKIYRDQSLSLDTFRQAQRSDPDLIEFFKPEISPEYKNIYLLQDNILHRKCIDGITRISLPDSLLKTIVFDLHFSKDGQHLSANMITSKLKQNYHSFNLLNKIKAITDTCSYCALNQTRRIPLHTMDNSFTVSGPRQIFSLDLAQGLPTITETGYNQIMVCVCNFSCYLILIPLTSKRASELLRAIEVHIIQPFYAPLAIRCDRESALAKSDKANEFAIKHSIKFYFTAPSAPATNGLAENQIAKTKQYLRINCRENKFTWPDNLIQLQHAFNSVPHQHGLTPEQIMFGTVLPHKTDPLQILPVPQTTEKYFENVNILLKRYHITVQRSQKRDRARRENFKNQHRKEKTFRIGQLVLLRDKIIAKFSALHSPWTGPYTIVDIPEYSHTAEIESITNGTRRKTHFNNIIPFKAGSFLTKLNKPWDQFLEQTKQEANLVTDIQISQMANNN